MTRHVVITGAASGLGLGCATRFVRLGDRVTVLDVNADAGARAAETLRTVARNTAAVVFEPIDLLDAASIAGAAERLRAHGTIDVLVNNAGIYPPSRRTLSIEGREITFAIAVLGHFRFTHAVWPLLSPRARIIHITSLTQRRASLALDDLDLAQDYTPLKAYAQAKLGCAVFAMELQRRLFATGSGITSYAVHPGVVRTGIGHNRRLSDQDTPWQRFSSWTLRNGLGRVGQSPEQGAESILLAATSEAIPPGSFVGPTWFFESVGTPKAVDPGPNARDPQLGQVLWARCEALTGLTWTI